ncbi:MAG: arginine--tRNA ligase [Bacilli bacterium]
MIDELLKSIKNELFKVINELGYVDETIISSADDILLELPKDKDHGDYATNIAMKLARVARKRPLDIAGEIVNNCDKTKMHIEKMEIAGPGFINLFIDLNYLHEVITKINLEKENYGNLSIGAGEYIDLEYVSANPTGYLHVGHGRGAAYGDSLSRIMKKAGYRVNREHYVNDAGNQITNMALSVYERYKELFGLPIEMKDDYYHGKEIITVAEEIKNEYGDKYLSQIDLDFFKEYGTKKLLGNLQRDLARFNVTFDTWFSEKSLYREGAVERVLTKLKEDGNTYEEDGAIWLKTTKYNDEKDRVIVKSDGSYTYLLPDIAYHANKLSRGYTHLIDVLGADHHGYIERLKAAVSMVGGNSNLIDIEILQMVRVMENGVEVKMSKRSGKAITLADLIDEVGTDALRYFYVSKSLSTHMDLDLDFMKQKSNDNPVFYAQYAHARICSVFKNYENLGFRFVPVTHFEHLNLEKTKAICLLLLQYPSVIEEVATKRIVHKITHFINELAYLLHSFYNDEKIITDNQEETNEKLTILNAIRIVLKDALALIGVSAPDKM